MDKQYFIQKFEFLKDEEVGNILLANHCALWHCGVRRNLFGGYRSTPEAIALMKLFGAKIEGEEPSILDYNTVTRINDAKSLSPRQNILQKLYSL